MNQNDRMFSVAFVHPAIAPNTGNAIRLAAGTGVHLHLVEPLGFDLSDAKLRRAGLDYHDLATVELHDDMDALWRALESAPNVYAFTAKATTGYAEVRYEPGDALLFGNEQTGLPDDILFDPRVREQLRIPMLSDRRSLNLSNCAALVVYEAWRQNGFSGGT
jgi:tRNA (cytidine/uridine-2'-O-)-methyltransferase